MKRERSRKIAVSRFTLIVRRLIAARLDESGLARHIGWPL